MSNPTIQIIIIVVTLLIALVVGLDLRHRLVRRLKKTVLDNWLIQIFGFLVIIPPVIVGIIVASFIIGIPPDQILASLQLVLKKIFNIQDLGSLIWNLVSSALIILLAIGVGRTLMKLVTVGTAKDHISINIRILLGRIFFTVVMLITLLWIFAIWNIQFAIPATFISVITVGFTFVMQDLLKNLVAGLYILVEGPFRIGDYITTDNYTGNVEDVQLRATKLRIASGEQVIVPNAKLFSDIVINKTIHKERRATITITMPQEEYDKAQTTERILEVIKEVDGVMVKPEPTLSLIGVAGSFGTSTGTVTGYTGEIITLTLRFWIPGGQDALVSEAMLVLRTALPRADLAIREPEGM